MRYNTSLCVQPHFIPDRKIALLYASTSKMFEETLKKCDETKPIDDLRASQADLAKFEEFLLKFGFEGNDQYILDEGPSEYSLMHTHAQLKQVLKSTAPSRTLVVHVFAGHSLEVDGLESMILNELDNDDSNFCVCYSAE